MKFYKIFWLLVFILFFVFFNGGINKAQAYSFALTPAQVLVEISPGEIVEKTFIISRGNPNIEELYEVEFAGDKKYLQGEKTFRLLKGETQYIYYLKIDATQAPAGDYQGFIFISQASLTQQSGAVSAKSVIQGNINFKIISEKQEKAPLDSEKTIYKNIKLSDFQFNQSVYYQKDKMNFSFAVSNQNKEQVSGISYEIFLYQNEALVAQETKENLILSADSTNIFNFEKLLTGTGNSKLSLHLKYQGQEIQKIDFFPTVRNIYAVVFSYVLLIGSFGFFVFFMILLCKKIKCNIYSSVRTFKGFVKKNHKEVGLFLIVCLVGIVFFLYDCLPSEVIIPLTKVSWLGVPEYMLTQTPLSNNQSRLILYKARLQEKTQELTGNWKVIIENKDGFFLVPLSRQNDKDLLLYVNNKNTLGYPLQTISGLVDDVTFNAAKSLLLLKIKNNNEDQFIIWDAYTSKQYLDLNKFLSANQKIEQVVWDTEDGNVLNLLVKEDQSDKVAYYQLNPWYEILEIKDNLNFANGENKKARDIFWQGQGFQDNDVKSLFKIYWFSREKRFYKLPVGLRFFNLTNDFYLVKNNNLLQWFNSTTGELATIDKFDNATLYYLLTPGQKITLPTINER